MDNFCRYFLYTEFSIDTSVFFNRNIGLLDITGIVEK